MSDLLIHIDTIIRCEVCLSTKDYSSNGTAEELQAMKMSNAFTFEDVAIDYFKNEGWTRGQDDDWYCPDHSATRLSSSKSIRNQKEAA